MLDPVLWAVLIVETLVPIFDVKEVVSAINEV